MVYLGIAPPDTAWYLRFYININWDDHDEEVTGLFNITLPKKIANQFRESVVSELDFSLIEQAAADYYKRIIVK